MTFTPNPGQQRALDEVLTTGKRNCLIYGGSRSGKTALITACVIDRALASPGSRHLVVRKEGLAAKRAIAKDTLPKIWVSPPVSRVRKVMQPQSFMSQRNNLPRRRKLLLRSFLFAQA